MSDITMNLCFSGDPSTSGSNARKLSGTQLKNMEQQNGIVGHKFTRRQKQRKTKPTSDASSSQRSKAEALIRAHMDKHIKKHEEASEEHQFRKNNSFTKHPSCQTSSHHQPSLSVTAGAGVPSKFLAIDCEMVGTGPKGCVSQLARCSVVTYEGDVVYDKFIKPSMPVTNYRTRWSGIRPCDLSNATPFHQARKEVLKLLMGKVVVGHAVHNDFKVLQYSHPPAMTRDTSRIPLLNEKAGFNKRQCVALKKLTKAIFNRDIQAGCRGHSSVEDARATMELYKVVEDEWEKTLASGQPVGSGGS
ncbi:interferon-stimulated 20 kDa exonuclease-like 2 [Dunckerocampus dactyliophorus]|uniref:interferon-stimulated 20 kDa exonuclease-like 2 n=1 Tax=Dunckerocampus dactyliophorus TaxID=161453 RepID=UPI002404BF7E|nr:interferon-stimulated 20 kDa exonuclease-like 2 [Dunckerocampus dactyliophorus]XP_054637910.1 interferon-stimulated 20 kDa exonuclease-like 2 [Dunckerocampus dactyliophorus]